MTKAYLIKLEGMGDSEWKLVDQVAWDYLNLVESSRPKWPEPFPPMTVPPSMIADYRHVMEIEAQESEPDDSIIGYLTPNHNSSSPDNDIAMSMTPSRFNGEYCGEASVRAVNAFCKKHGLELADEYEGGLY